MARTKTEHIRLEIADGVATITFARPHIKNSLNVDALKELFEAPSSFRKTLRGKFGMQIAGGPFQEELIFSVAHAYEQATDWHNRRPQVAVS